MSIYRDTNTRATFEHPHPGPLNVEVFRSDVKIKEVSAVMPVDEPNSPNLYSIPLTFEDTQFDGELDIKWFTDSFSRTTSIKVVTPIVSLSKLQTVFEDTNKTLEELKEIEASVRIAIESYTRQSFGYFIGTQVVVGNGENKVVLPRRLIKAINVSGGPPSYFSIANTGWHLYIGNKNMLSIKEAPPEDYMESPTYMTHGVIVVPDSYWKQFRIGARYTIEGEWGYYSVPEDVQEAALLLANDIACGDSIYRDRYIEMIKSADWNFSFSPGAYRATGNVRVDQLLSPYKRDGMIII